MEKFKKIFVSLALVVVLAIPVLFAGCSLSDIFGGGSSKKVADIQVVGEIKTEYLVGDSFDANGAKIKVVYDDNSTLEVSLDKGMTNFDSTTVGKKDLIVKYEGKTKTLEYRVDAFKMGTYEMSTVYYGQGGLPVETTPYAQTNTKYEFEKDGIVNYIYFNQMTNNNDSIQATWEYKTNSIITVDFHDDLGQLVEINIETTSKLWYVFSTNGGTTPNGLEYASVRQVLNFAN